MKSWVSSLIAGQPWILERGTNTLKKPLNLPLRRISTVNDFLSSVPYRRSSAFCERDLGEVGPLHLIFVVGRCGMHIHALPGAPQFGVASELIYPGARARKPPVPAHFHLHQDPHYFHGCGIPRQTAIQLPAERVFVCVRYCQVLT